MHIATHKMAPRCLVSALMAVVVVGALALGSEAASVGRLRSVAQLRSSLTATGRAGGAPVSLCDISGIDIAAITKLRYLNMNKRINAAYVKFAECFQSIAQGELTSKNDFGQNHTPGTWFAAALYASRKAGYAFVALGKLIKLFEPAQQQQKDDKDDTPWYRLDLKAAELVKETGESLDKLKTFVTTLGEGMSAGSKSGNMKSMANLSVLKTTLSRAFKLIQSAPGSSTVEKTKAVAQTIYNALEDGNRHIFQDIAGLAFTWLTERAKLRASAGGKPDAKKIATAVAASVGGKIQQVEACLAWAKTQFRTKPLPFQFDDIAEVNKLETANLLICSLWLYEHAGQTPADRANIIKLANSILLYREQKVAVQPAYTPSKPVPGEVDRVKAFEMATPTIAIGFRGERGWSFYDNYCVPKNIDITKSNWGIFKDRWTPIGDALTFAYADPGSFFPLENPDADPDQK